MLYSSWYFISHSTGGVSDLISKTRQQVRKCLFDLIWWQLSAKKLFFENNEQEFISFKSNKGFIF